MACETGNGGGGGQVCGMGRCLFNFEVGFTREGEVSGAWVDE